MARFPIISMNTEYNITIVAVNRAGNGSPTLKMIMPIEGFLCYVYTYVYCTYIICPRNVKCTCTYMYVCMYIITKGMALSDYI